MFERYVTARRISVNPSDAAAFVDYFWVQQKRLTNQIIDVFGSDLFSKPELQAELQDTSARYEAVKEKFRIACCKGCDDTRINHTWTRLDVVSMARNIGGGAKELTVSGYYLPMKQIHSTLGAIVSRFDAVSGELVYTGAVDRKQSDQALETAHLLVLGAVALQLDHFSRHSAASALRAMYARLC